MLSAPTKNTLWTNNWHDGVQEQERME